MNKNRSSVYGYYGGVTPENHYTPPPVPPVVPQPPRARFTPQDAARLAQLVDQTEFFAENSPNILIRTNVSSTSGNVDTFVLSTSANPQDVIVYTSEQDNYNLNVLNGGSF